MKLFLVKLLHQNIVYFGCNEKRAFKLCEEEKAKGRQCLFYILDVEASKQ